VKRNILIIGNSHPSSIENMFYHSFKKLNLKVNFLDPNLSLKNFQRNKFYFKLFKKDYYKAYNAVLYQNLQKKYLSNIIFFFKGENLNKELMKKIKKFKDNIYINFYTDNPFYKQSKDYQLIKFFDFYFTWSRNTKKKIITKKLLKKNKVHYIPFGFDSRYRKKSNYLNSSNGRYLFYGSWDKQRERLIDSLQLNNIDIYGNGWENSELSFKYNYKIYFEDIYGQKLSNLINKYHAVINLNRPQVLKAHNMRLFEVTGYGGLIVTNETEETLSFFKKNEEIITYKNNRELKDIVKSGIKISDIKRMRKKSFIKSKKHSYENRCKKILKILNNDR
tara:strand:- start:73 stop:1074 length:1002 start_codon:yes stop_codon:yes gene_type:complete